MADSLHVLGEMRSLPSPYVKGGWGFGATCDNRTVHGSAGIAQPCLLLLCWMIAVRLRAEVPRGIISDTDIALVASRRAAGIRACHGFTYQQHGGQNHGRR